MGFVCPFSLILVSDFLDFGLIHIFLFSLIYAIENTQLVKQKSNSNKRGDKRGFKVPAKIKYDSFSMKAGLSNFSSAVGGNNFFGMTLSHKIVPFINESFNLFEESLLIDYCKYTNFNLY
jgi:hypothetical protein